MHYEAIAGERSLVEVISSIAEGAGMDIRRHERHRFSGGWLLCVGFRRSGLRALRCEGHGKEDRKQQTTFAGSRHGATSASCHNDQGVSVWPSTTEIRRLFPKAKGAKSLQDSGAGGAVQPMRVCDWAAPPTAIRLGGLELAR